MKIGNIFGWCIGVGILVSMIINKNYGLYGLIAGIGIAALIVYIKNKKR